MAGRKIFIVYAHPEPRSLNGALKELALSTLRAQGHEVEVSDLYAMNWKANADGADFPQRDPEERLHYGRASRAAFDAGTQAPDVVREQEKLLWADAVILQFPLWWFSVPAILKGWIDRVFANGFAYGIGVFDGKRYGTRYGEGTLAGKRALVAITAGGQPAHFSDRGINGRLADLLFPLTHGTLYYTGMQVLPPFAARCKSAVRRAIRAGVWGLRHAATRPFRRCTDSLPLPERRRI
jgi:NAD(P)H dehydrogenase (quinone)